MTDITLETTSHKQWWNILRALSTLKLQTLSIRIVLKKPTSAASHLLSS